RAEARPGRVVVQRAKSPCHAASTSRRASCAGGRRVPVSSWFAAKARPEVETSASARNRVRRDTGDTMTTQSAPEGTQRASPAAPTVLGHGYRHPLFPAPRTFGGSKHSAQGAVEFEFLSLTFEIVRQNH